jgi:TolA-binding protein
MDPNGKEQYRIEGYLTKPEFQAQLQLGLARLAFKAKKWSDAEQAYADVVKHFPKSSVAAQAQYWAGVSEYQRTHDPAILAQTGKILADKYPDTVWAAKGSVWLT